STHEGDVHDFGVRMKEMSDKKKMWIDRLEYDDDRGVALCDMSNGTDSIRFSCMELHNERTTVVSGVIVPECLWLDA
ncbi:hypothetical protein RZS08_02275, partial [Arthrospira platensis SPKY1]|nr:hypothetical protein [Arthrospira platensis SPKY1]